MNYEQAIKPTAFMNQDALETMYPYDCFFAFAEPTNQASVPLFTLDQVKAMIRHSNLSTYDAEDFIDEAFQ
jgi:hypothetical protein